MWTKVALDGAVAEGKGLAVSAQGASIAVFRISGKLCAMDNLCPHRGGPLAEGALENGEVTCPWHAWTFDVRSGECRTVPAFKQMTFPVKSENGEIWIDL